MYIATTAVIVRTQKPLITVNIKPVIKIFAAIIPHPVPAQAQTAAMATQTDAAPQIAAAPAATKQPDTKPASGDEFPNAMPSELRGAFIRARQNADLFTPSTYTKPAATPVTQSFPTHDTTPTAPTTSDTGEMPLPTDFDAPADSDLVPVAAMPTFTDINFGDDNDDNDKKSDTTENTATPAPATDGDNNRVMDYLTQHGATPRRDGDLIIANDIVIATHDDPDFWIADPENWFATGKQIASPITQLIKASAQNGLRPVLYLAQTNIMDLDTCRAEWKKMGVTTITDLSELPL